MNTRIKALLVGMALLAMSVMFWWIVISAFSSGEIIFGGKSSAGIATQANNPVAYWWSILLFGFAGSGGGSIALLSIRFAVTGKKAAASKNQTGHARLLNG